VNAVELELGTVRTTGWVAAVLLMLAIAPSRKQRLFGLASLAAGLLHFAIAFATPLVPDLLLLIYEPHLRSGATALLVLCFLGATSFPALVKRAGIRQWKPLHRAVYLAALMVLLHAFQSPHLPRVGAIALSVGAGSLIARRIALAIRDRARRSAGAGPGERPDLRSSRR